MTAAMAAVAPDDRSLGRLAGKDLTAREVEVLDLVSRGLTNAQVAGRLFLAEVTVKTHMLRIMRKLGATGREHAVRLAIEEGYLAVVPVRRQAVALVSLRRTLAGRLEFLDAEAAKLPNTALGEVFHLHLARAVRDAAIQADEIAMLRAQAADRERVRALVQQVAALVDGFDPSAGGADLVLAAVRDVVKQAGSPESNTNPRGSQS